MSTEDSIRQRAQSLESAFFAKLDQELLGKLREDVEAQHEIEQLKKITGVHCDNALAELQAAGLTSETAAALRLVPLVEVAWGDGRIEESEKNEVLRAAHQQGIEDDSPTGKLLAAWLESHPPQNLLDAWVEYATELKTVINDDALSELRSALTTEMKEVATSAGGLLGYGAVSRGESKVMHRVEEALAKN